MAKSSGKSTGKKARPRKKTTAKKTVPPAKRKASPVATEVKYLGVAALGILLLLSVCVEGAVGFVGQIIRGLCVGMLGFGAYVLPFAIMAAAVYALFSKSRRVPPAVFKKAAIFLWCLIALLHIITMKELAEYPGLFAYFSAIYTEGSATNGGLMGALLGNLLRRLLGSAGAYILLVAGGLITLLLLTGRSFVHLMTAAAEGLRRFFSGMSGAWAEDRTFEDEDEEDMPPEKILLPPQKLPERKSPALKPLPAKASKRKASDKPSADLLVIEEKANRDPRKVLLVHEEIAQDKPPHPIFAPRKPSKTTEAAPRDSEVAVLTAPVRKTERPRDTGFVPGGIHPVDDTPLKLDDKESDITVKGLVERDMFPSEDFPEAFPESADWDAEDEDDIDPYDVPAAVMPFPAPTSASREPAAPVSPAPLRVVQARPKPSASGAAARDAAAVRVPSGSVTRYEDYEFPPISLLTQNQVSNTSGSRMQILENSRILEETLKSFRVEAKVVEVSVGPTVTRYDLAPGPGVKVSAIANLSNDLALSLAAQGIRIEAPIPGKAAVGIEIPNKDPQPVLLREIIEDDNFQKFPSRLAFAVGKDIAGSPVVTDVARMPHLLIAGATGSGKSVCINTLITSLLYKSRPDEVKLLMIDPKVVELSVYNGIPHLLIPVVTDPKKASGALQWAVAEMDNRYALFAEAGVRDLKGFNNYKAEEEDEDNMLPQIVIIIDELADLMMACKGEVEESICRLAQKARAAGIHLIVATQRPSVDVITGLIKANIPSRLAFAVSSGTDSRTVLDMYGAEKLLGKGDMLFLPMGRNKPIRLQGGYISDQELENVVDFLKQQTITEYPEEMIEKVTASNRAGQNDEDLDEFFHEAVEFLLEKGKASTSMLQRQFRIGYNRASRLMEDLETRGIVGPEDGVKPRKIMMTREEYITTYQS